MGLKERMFACFTCQQTALPNLVNELSDTVKTENSSAREPEGENIKIGHLSELLPSTK